MYPQTQGCRQACTARVDASKLPQVTSKSQWERAPSRNSSTFRPCCLRLQRGAHPPFSELEQTIWGPASALNPLEPTPNAAGTLDVHAAAGLTVSVAGPWVAVAAAREGQPAHRVNNGVCGAVEEWRASLLAFLCIALL